MLRQSGLIPAYAVSILLGFNPVFTQAKPHEHGVAQLEISLSGNDLQLRFVSACLATEVDADADDETAAAEPPDPAAAWDACVADSPWLVRMLAAGLVGRLRQVFDTHLERATDTRPRDAGGAEAGVVAAATSLADAGQGLELVLVRTRRLMEQAGLRRIDVLYEPFDAEQMRAIDIVEDAAVPEGHVAKQFRPGYAWHGVVLRPAEVGVAR